MKKRILVLIFAAALIAIPSFHSASSNAGPSPSGKTALSTLTTEEKLAFLQAYGVDVPSEYSRYVTSFISLLEENPDYPIIISNPVLYRLCEQTRDAVNNYYQRNSSQISSSDKRALSDMTTEEKLAFLQAQGVDVPSEYSRFITSFISLVEENPDYPSGISNPVLYRLCEQTRDAVIHYYQEDL